MDVLSSIKQNGIILDQKDIIMLEDPDIYKEYQCSKNISCSGFTLLHKLVLLTNKYPKLNIVIKEYIILYPEEVNKPNNYLTALHLASLNSNNCSNIDTVKLLLEHNADINAKSTISGTTALMYASTYSNSGSSVETVKLLLEHNADINAKSTNSGTTALMYAVYNFNSTSSIETVKLLLMSCELDINATSNNGWTALMYALVYHSEICTEIVKLLLMYNINVNAKDIHGRTALMIIAPYLKNEKVLKLLLEYEAIFNGKFPDFIDNIRRLNTKN